jgi:diguanylate cyclase (GGDEF)-like protein
VISDSWSTSQLVEFLAVVAAQTDETTALRAAVERVLESLDAEVGVLFNDDGVATVVGLAADDDRISTLIAAAQSSNNHRVQVPGLGECRTAVVRLDVDPDALRLLVARASATGFVPEEMLLLRGMAWVLHFALRPLRVLVGLNERQKVLEAVARVQRFIANRAPLPQVFDAVTEGALDLFGTELALLYLADQGILVLASVSTVSDEYRPPSWPVRLKTSIGRAAYSQGELVRTDDYPNSIYARPELVTRGAQAAIAAPVQENGTVVGSLVIFSFRRGHAFTDIQERTLLTFADQVSTALSDAKTLTTAQYAVRDAVTGLPNRVFFLERLTQALAHGVPVHILFLDLDRFKLVNDTFGHDAGDDLLRQVGRRLRECLRSGDCLARFGGDEFAVLIESRAQAEVCQVAQRMLAAMGTPYLVGGEEVEVGASIGISASTPEVAARSLLGDADTAMYRAKHAGGGRVVTFEKSMRTVLVQRASMERDLRRAVHREELFVVFQPILELRTGCLRAAEALVRWQHPSRGVVAPSEFIPLAEETGLVTSIGRRVLAAACAEAVGWSSLADGGTPPGVSVNLSARQLLDPGLVRDIGQILDATGLDPTHLTLEITESTFVNDTTAVLDRLRRIRDIGVRLAIDDFGTGYSALAYLRRLPVDILKIDRTFVEGVVVGWQGSAFLQAIVRLTETMSITAVGEGVETEEQLSALRRVGCQLGQGYLFAKPMPADEFRRNLGPMLHTGSGRLWSPEATET